MCNALLGRGLCVVISNLTVYTLRPATKGFSLPFGSCHSLGDGYLTSALPDNFALIVRGSQCDKKAVNSQRPVNLDLRTIKLPITGVTSFLHRVSGIILFFGIAVLLYGLDKSLASAEGFAEVKECLTSPLAKFVIWGLLSALLYHLVAGIRHLIMDMGIGETLEGGKLGSKIVIVVSAIVIALLGVWIW